MALYTTLEIYRAAYGLLKACADPLTKMPRNARAVFGVRLRDRLLDMVELIRDANVATNKVPHLDTLLRSHREAEVLLRLFHDKRYMSHGQYAHAIEFSVSLGRQANGWRNKYVASPAT